MTERTDPGPWLDALAGSHDRLCEIVGELDAAGLRSPSYCDRWSIAEVLSHLGSGAEIFQLALDAAVAGDPPPGRDSFPPIWEHWNAMTAEEQAEGFASTDGRLVESLEHLGDRLDELEFDLFGSVHVDAAGFLGFRLSEHAVHAWDVAVSLDPAATVEHDAVALLVDRLPQTAARSGSAEELPGERPFRVGVRTADPTRHFALVVADTVDLEPAKDDEVAAGAGPHEGADATSMRTLELPAEAFVRLVYGRLDPAHTPEVDPPEVVERLRPVFRGF